VEEVIDEEDGMAVIGVVATPDPDQLPARERHGRHLLRRMAIVTAVAGLASVAFAGSALAAVSTVVPGGYTNGRVQALTRIAATNTIYAGGTFTVAKDKPGAPSINRHNLAAYNASTGVVQGWNPGAPSLVRALANDGSRIFAGGDFGLRAYNQSGNQLSFPTPGGKVFTLKVQDGFLYVGGLFSTTVAGKVKTNSLRINLATNATDSVWKANTNGTVKGIDTPDGGGAVFLVGAFTKVNGTDVVNLAKVDTATGALQSFPFVPPPRDPQGRRSSRAIEVYSDKVVVAWTDGVNRTEVYRLSDAFKLKSWQADGDVQAIKAIGNTLYLGGHWVNKLGGVTSQRYIAFNSATLGSPVAFAQPNSPAMGCFAIVEDGGSGVWFGGDTTSVKGVSVGRIFHMV
jgi:hypothetical protein